VCFDTFPFPSIDCLFSSNKVKQNEKKKRFLSLKKFFEVHLTLPYLSSKEKDQIRVLCVDGLFLPCPSALFCCSFLGE